MSKLISATVYFLCLFTAPLTSAQVSSAPALELEVQQVEAKKMAVSNNLKQLPNRVDEEVDILLKDMDAFAAEEWEEIFQQHYSMVEKELEKVKFGEDVGRLEIYWSQLKAGATFDDSLEELVTTFFNNAHTTVEPTIELVTAEISKTTESHLSSALNASKARIEQPFKEYLLKEFPHYESAGLTQLGSGFKFSPSTDFAQTADAATAFAAVLAVVFRKSITKIITRVIGKLLGKIGSKFIPFIGQALLLLEIWDVGAARSALEKELRKEFMLAYREDFTPDTLWRNADEGDISQREATKSMLEDELKQWQRYCERAVQDRLNAALALELTPSSKAFIEKLEAQGSTQDAIMVTLGDMSKSFTPAMIRSVDLDKLFDLYVLAPNSKQLAQLTDELGPDLFWKSYDKSGRSLLDATDVLGPRLLASLIKDPQGIEWLEATEAVNLLPSDSSNEAKLGAIAMLRQGMDVKGVRASSLEAVSENEQTFGVLAKHLKSDREKLLQLLTDDKSLSTFEVLYGHNVDFAIACAKIWSHVAWSRYESTERREALLHVMDLYMEKFDLTDEAFADSLSREDALTPIYLRDGIDAVELWASYVTPGSGESQENDARLAIDLMRVGFPKEELQTKQGLEIAVWANRFPVLKLNAYELARRGGTIVSTIVMAFVALILLLAFVFTFGKIRAMRGSYRILRAATRRTVKLHDADLQVIDSSNATVGAPEKCAPLKQENNEDRTK